ncbi:unnamed protein product [Strongylus vulgaris]|uniref:Uncharacterized protein n=1 Tax=Strongylus vulgaris TaxID=40348 RepID=A0A3P7HW83_STRVU|nr:unnamed protein product [Strongylus vulgaris]
MFFAAGPGYIGGFEFKRDDYVNLTERAQLHYKQPTAIPYFVGSHGGEDVPLWADGPLSQSVIRIFMSQYYHFSIETILLHSGKH